AAQCWDVVVVGAGPAGSTAARSAAAEGARVLLLDKARFPRYKTCGGGLIAVSYSLLPPAARATVEAEVRGAVFSRSERMVRRRHASDALLRWCGVSRLTRPWSRQRSTPVRSSATASRSPGSRNGTDGPSWTSDRTRIEARVVVGADGSAGRCGRYVGVRSERVDLGLEYELAMPRRQDADPDGHFGPVHSGRGHGRKQARGWQDVRIDWGPTAGSYAWVFPKGDRLAVGVIQPRGNPDQSKAYLARWLHQLGLERAEVLAYSGHLAQWRTVDSPLARGCVLVAGDAAGLLEPCSREGISFPLRSGQWGGVAAGRASRAQPRHRADHLNDYCDKVRSVLGVGQRAGARLLRLLERHPALVHGVLGYPGPGWQIFQDVCTGQSGFSPIADGALTGRALKILGCQRRC
ncbi:MAG TPA: geranylgeranyl reductase family protein, partial [Arthrobacter sp.]|nr:geranylgeranyl reductase family protein [Arthrobacter sp.]